ncbi:hypothetical protein EYF80_034449 [Liparis tanakae]|uniref:Uncharacterized protein n=1 Tax=Liparis tanakae TaxID=230148 RepID=A0A4Z2GP41_9TELE|nr:hypothetical protein EYF80_034449 [Liparis tanakae]
MSVLPESERTTSLSSRGSLLSISSSSSSSPSLPSGLQPSAAHSSCSLASVSSVCDEPCRLCAASQSLSTRFCWRECSTASLCCLRSVWVAARDTWMTASSLAGFPNASAPFNCNT